MRIDVPAACRNVHRARSSRRAVTAQLCRQKLLFPYKAPLSRTILFEWLRKMPNWELGIAVSSAAVSFDRRKNSRPLSSPSSSTFRTLLLPTSSAAVTRLCGEIVVALFSSPPCPLLHRLRSPPPAPSHFLFPTPERRSTFLRGCWSIWANIVWRIPGGTSWWWNRETEKQREREREDSST